MNKDGFKDMPNNPFVVGNKRMIEVYPKLSRIEAFTVRPYLNGDSRNESDRATEEMLETMIRFVVIFIEPRGNPLAKDPDLLYRAKAAWKLLGVPETNILQKMQLDWHWWYTQLVFEYFKVTNDMMYALWYAKKSQFYANIKVLGSGLDDSISEADAGKRERISAQTTKLVDELTAMEARLFGDQVLANSITFEAFFPNRIPEMFALDWASKERREQAEKRKSILYGD